MNKRKAASQTKPSRRVAKKPPHRKGLPGSNARQPLSGTILSSFRVKKTRVKPLNRTARRPAGKSRNGPFGQRLYRVERELPNDRRAGELLRREKEFSEHIIATAQVIILVLDVQGRIVRFNPYLEQISGYRSNEMAGKDWFKSFLPKADRKQIRRLFPKSLRGNSVQGKINAICTKDGSVRMIEWNDTPLRDAAGKITGILAIGRDITNRISAEERITHLNRIQSILVGVDQAIVHLADRQQLLDEVCRVAVERGGFKLSWIGMVSEDGMVEPVAKAGAVEYLDGIVVTVSAKAPEGRGPVGTAIRENRPVVVEDIDCEPSMNPWRSRTRQFGLRHAAAIPIHIAGRVMGAFQVYAPRAGFFDENELGLLKQVGDDISFALTALADVAARKEAEEALRRSERNLAVFFENAPIGLAWLSASGIILRANQTLLDFCGGASSDCLGHSFHEFLVQPSQGYELLGWLGAKKTIRNYRLSIRSQNGEVRYVLLSANSIWNGDQFLYSSIFLRDVTDRVRLEREIVQAGEREHRRIFQDLHDGLGQILVGAAYLANNLQKDLAAKSLPEARQSGRLLELINEATTQTRSLARGLHTLEPEPGGLMLALERLAARTKNTFQIGCHFTCRRPVLIRDNAVAFHLYRIAQEAITNAIKHGKPRHIKISLTEATGRIILAVRDDGHGLPAHPLKKPGMGVRIMNHRAGLIGASLTIQKQPAGGTDVVCTVPLNGEVVRSRLRTGIRRKTKLNEN